MKISYRFDSNNFNIKVFKDKNHPPVLTNSLSDISMYYGQESKAVELPDDLFTDPDGDKLKYNSTNWFDPGVMSIGTTVDKRNEK